MSTKCWKTVLVLGGAYGGAKAAQVLAAGVPKGWRVIVIDRNSHVNHTYVLPRYAVLPGHERKAFVPYHNIFMLDGESSPHLFLQAHVVSIHKDHVVLSRSFPEHGIPTTTLPFDYAVYALGSRLPAPLDLWGAEPDDLRLLPRDSASRHPYAGSKDQGIAWLQRSQDVIRDASSIAIIGGGALGVQFATDIAAVYPDKSITLIHSRNRLLPRFKEDLHLEILNSLEMSNVEAILGERLDMSSVDAKYPKVNETGQRVVRTLKGREIAADLILLCTGQVPNTELLCNMDNRTIARDSQLAHVLPSLQLGILPNTGDDSASTTAKETTPYPHIFVIGDAADAFGAIKAGHNAWYQAQVAANNILKLIHQEDTFGTLELETYTPGSPAIKVSLGLTKSVYEVNGTVGVANNGKDDLDAALIWPFFGAKVENDSDMYA